MYGLVRPNPTSDKIAKVVDQILENYGDWTLEPRPANTPDVNGCTLVTHGK